MADTTNAVDWLVDRHGREGRGGRVALRCGDEELTYDGLRDATAAMAAGLARAGLVPGDRVLLVLLDSLEYAVAFLGALRGAFVPVPVNPLLPGRDAGAIAALAEPRLALVSAERATVVVGELGVPTVVTASDEWAALVAAGASGEPMAIEPDGPGFWLCTSGTTGRPKLAMHRHGDLRATYATYATTVLGITAEDVAYSVGPAFHAYGLGNSLTFPLGAGASAVLEPTRPPTPQHVAAVMAAHRPTVFSCVPTFYAALVASDLPDDTFASVRYGVSAAEPLPAVVWQRFRDRFGVEILDGIGSTEMTHIFISNRPGRIVPGTSGWPVEGYEARLSRLDGGGAPPGEPGVLWVRGPSAAIGYWKDAATSAATFADGWARTGDLYQCSPTDGTYTYLGRVDDMLKVGGEWVSPAEVEATLLAHEGVLEAAVVGERDAAGVVRPIAFVVPVGAASLDPDELIEFTRTRLAGYKRPRHVEVVSELPKTATGKIQRFKLSRAVAP